MVGCVLDRALVWSHLHRGGAALMIGDSNMTIFRFTSLVSKQVVPLIGDKLNSG
jgi:hypothetical protein